MKDLQIKVYGRVQGVFFRDSVKRQADILGIKGFAKNEPDGSVYIEAEGEEDILQEFVRWCKTGPDLAYVNKVEIEEGDVKNFEDFQVR